MKIYSCCNWKLKFLGPILDYWRQQGHEVEYTLGYDPAKHEWSDTTFIDVCDNNAIVGSKYKFPNSRLVIRCIDIETWVRQPRAVKWENVDAVVFGARHIADLVESYMTFPDNVEIHRVPFGLDLSKWTYRERAGGTRVAFIGVAWIAKGLALALQLMMSLDELEGMDWTLHCLMDDFKRPSWFGSYVDHIIAESGVKVEFARRVPDVNEWLEDKDYLLVPGHKEAFSYVAAEAAAKGIQPVIHNFWRAKDIWPESWVWNSLYDARRIMFSPYDSAACRRFIEENYSVEHMMEGLNRACQIGGQNVKQK